MKIRLEGTQAEISQVLPKWQAIGIPTNSISKTLEVQSISKFYENRDFQGKEKVGRVYVEVK